MMVKILIVDDDPLIVGLYEKAFASGGYDVEAAFDGEQALEKLDKMSDKPTLILMDVMMPKMNGLQTLEKMKKNPRTRNIPVVMLTNLSDEGDAEKALTLGAITYLVKSQYKPREVVIKAKEIIAGYTPHDIPEVEVPIKGDYSEDKDQRLK